MSLTVTKPVAYYTRELITIKKVLLYNPQIGNNCEIISETLKLNLKTKKKSYNVGRAPQHLA
jgi:hypothetical protein